MLTLMMMMMMARPNVKEKEKDRRTVVTSVTMPSNDAINDCGDNGKIGKDARGEEGNVAYNNLIVLRRLYGKKRSYYKTVASYRSNTSDYDADNRRNGSSWTGSSSGEQRARRKRQPWSATARHPFKNPHWKAQKAAKRGSKIKTLKQIISAGKKLDRDFDLPKYSSIQVSKSKKLSKKYCDITGYEAKYRDPRTGMRYASAEVFRMIRSLSEGVLREYRAVPKLASGRDS